MIDRTLLAVYVSICFEPIDCRSRQLKTFAWAICITRISDSTGWYGELENMQNSSVLFGAYKFRAALMDSVLLFTIVLTM